MDDVLDLAERLAALLAAHPRTLAFRDATKVVTADADARTLQEEYTVAIEDVRGREAAGTPVEPEAKRALAALGERIRKSPILQTFLRANLEFNELMDAVNHTIGGAVDAALFPDAPRDGDHTGHAHGPGEACGSDGGPAADPPPEDEPKKGPILWTP